MLKIRSSSRFANNNNALACQGIIKGYIDSQTSFASVPRLQIHVVISHYNEDFDLARTYLDELRDVFANKDMATVVFLYTKNQIVDLAIAKQRTGANCATRLPNTGREGGTYLYHMLHMRQHLGDFTLFTQVCRFGPSLKT